MNEIEAYERGVKDGESRAHELHKLGASYLLFTELKEIESNYCSCEHGRRCLAHDVMDAVMESLTKHLKRV